MISKPLGEEIKAWSHSCHRRLTQAGHTKCYMAAFLQRDTWSQNCLILQDLDCNLIKGHDLQTLGRKYKTCLDIWSHLVTFLSQKTLTLRELDCNMICLFKVTFISKHLEGERTTSCYMPAFLQGHTCSQNRYFDPAGAKL